MANKYKMVKHFEFTVGEGVFSYRRNEEGIAAKAALDRFYMIRTSVEKELWVPEQVVLSYKSLSRVERAFRTFKGVDLKIRPIHHRLKDRIRASMGCLEKLNF